ncbi:hypothetical protein J6590_058096 [Homalodisca vitripennis]|nr:hypothetical protein J6590_058096 [Homalodisca vitripennis]
MHKKSAKLRMSTFLLQVARIRTRTGTRAGSGRSAGPDSLTPAVLTNAGLCFALNKSFGWETHVGALFRPADPPSESTSLGGLQTTRVTTTLLVYLDSFNKV